MVIQFLNGDIMFNRLKKKMNKKLITENLTSKEFLKKNFNIDEKNKFHSYDYLYKSMIEIVEHFSQK